MNHLVNHTMNKRTNLIYGLYSYQEWLQSEQFKEMKYECLKRCGYKCFLCGRHLSTFVRNKDGVIKKMHDGLCAGFDEVASLQTSIDLSTKKITYYEICPCWQYVRDGWDFGFGFFDESGYTYHSSFLFHHLTYENLGREVTPFSCDIKLACQKCHDNIKNKGEHCPFPKEIIWSKD